MHRIHKTLMALGFASIVAVPAIAQPFELTTKLQERTTISPLANHGLPTLSCAETCLMVIVDRTEQTCAPYFAPPTEGCDLPWAEPGAPPHLGGFNPTPLPWDDVFSCVPDNPSVAGYELSENRQVVQQMIHNHSDCTTTVTETVLSTPPPNNNGAGRSCPDGGPWVDTQETASTMWWVACPAPPKFP